MSLLEHIIWPLNDEELVRTRLVREGNEDEEIPPLPEGTTLEDYLTQPLNLTTDENGKIVLVFPGIVFLQLITEVPTSVNSLKSRGKPFRVTKPLELEFEAEQLQTGLDVIGALNTFFKTPVPLDVLRKYDTHERANPEASLEELRQQFMNYGPGREVTYRTLIFGARFFGLVPTWNEETGTKEQGSVIPGHYSVKIN